MCHQVSSPATAGVWPEKCDGVAVGGADGDGEWGGQRSEVWM